MTAGLLECWYAGVLLCWCASLLVCCCLLLYAGMLLCGCLGALWSFVATLLVFCCLLLYARMLLCCCFAAWVQVKQPRVERRTVVFSGGNLWWLSSVGFVWHLVVVFKGVSVNGPFLVRNPHHSRSFPQNSPAAASLRTRLRRSFLLRLRLRGLLSDFRICFLPESSSSAANESPLLVTPNLLS
ncbi:hypothetical protein Droror1_Dr00016289 [Drosera rotundifolia]